MALDLPLRSVSFFDCPDLGSKNSQLGTGPSVTSPWGNLLGLFLCFGQELADCTTGA